MEYESLLRSLSYNNTAMEPTSGPRLVNISLSDGLHGDITAVITIVVLVSPDPLILLCGRESAVFLTAPTTSSPVSLTESLTLVDIDMYHVITGATVFIQNPQEGDVITLNDTAIPGVTITPESGSRIVVSGDALATYYQVCDNNLLRSVSV